MCGFVATHEALLRQHMGSQKCVKGKVLLHCDECSFQTQFQPYLKKHIRTVHEKLPCTVCGKIISKVRLTIHMNIFHTEEKKKPFLCKTCNKGFSCKKSFQEHSNIHTGERPFQCDLCEKRFASSGNMYMHRRISHYGYKRMKWTQKQNYSRFFWKFIRFDLDLFANNCNWSATIQK
jgi:KRAB domain-containing zinc finger protein